VGVILFAQLGPLLLLAMVGGALADTVDRKRLLIWVTAQMVLSFALAVVAAPDDPNLVVLVAVVFAIGVGQALFAPTYSALLPSSWGATTCPVPSRCTRPT
jgi:MFS family permease